MPSFKTEIKQALVYYKIWKKQKSYCPALKSYVLVTNSGWNHLVGNKGYKQRILADKYRRLKLLPYAKQIIENSHTIQDIRTINGRVYYSLDAVIPVDQGGIKHLRKVRVVIHEDKKGNKIFFSVMDKKS